MLRITEIANAPTRTLKLEGKLVGPWVDELARACAEAGRVCLDLSAVSFVDSAGVKLLKQLAAGGACLSACSGLVAALLKPEEDIELLRQARGGDERASEQIVRRHAGRMLAVARRFLRSEEDSADAVQDAFLSAFRSLDTFAGSASLATWLHRIVVNASLMKFRSRSRRRSVSIDNLLPGFDETGHHARPVPAWGEQPHALLAQAETRAAVRVAIDDLPEPHREVLLLRDIEELDTDETAQHLGISAGAVKTRLHRARQALRELLEPIFVRGPLA